MERRMGQILSDLKNRQEIAINLKPRIMYSNKKIDDMAMAHMIEKKHIEHHMKMKNTIQDIEKCSKCN